MRIDSRLELRSPDGPEGPGGAAPTPQPRRAGSITLRENTGGGADGSPLDPANQSLADALKIMLGLLQLGMFVLAGLYILSGLQSVKEGEQGLRLLFGERQGAALDPGFHMSAPYPLGELLKVSRGYKEIDIDKDFWVYVPDGTPEGTSIEKLVASESLKPDQGGSGSVLTADRNIAHTKWRVGYRRDDVVKYSKNVLPDDEDRMVRAAVKRGVVRACAQATIDELLKQSADQAASIASRAKRVAQQTLDDMDSGIVIDQLTLTQTTPPLATRNEFARVQSAVANAAKAVKQAESESASRLNQVAGEAAPALVKLINQYEDATLRNDQAALTATLADIDAVLQGREVPGASGPVRVSGDVTTKLADAGRYRSAVVTQAKGRMARFEAKSSQFKANPTLMIHKEWTDAVTSFLNRDTVQITLVPREIATMRMQINADPDILKKIDQSIKEKEGVESVRKRMEEMNKNRFKTDTTSIKAAG
ncbi:MAG: hypothetical protein JSR77_08655 [Planctomycetes bacterium]|nr:hypothetical protein [Planctomycetota bacterium]